MAGMRYQPQGNSVRINRSNPLTRGLVFAWVPANDSLAKSGTVPRVATPKGVAFSTNQTVYAFSNSAPAFSLDDCSLTAILTPTNVNTSAGTYAVACGNSADSNPLFMVGQDGTSPRLGFRTRDAVGTDISAASTSAYWADGVSAFVSGTRSKASGFQRLYINGQQIAQSAVGTASASTTFNRLTIGGLLRSSFALGWSGSTGLVLIHNRALSAAEVAALAANPWQVFEDSTAEEEFDWYAAEPTVDLVITPTSGATSGSSQLAATAAAIASAYGSSTGAALNAGGSASVFAMTAASSGSSAAATVMVGVFQATAASSGQATAQTSSVTIATAGGTSSGVASLSGNGYAIWNVDASTGAVSTAVAFTNAVASVEATANSQGSSVAGASSVSFFEAVAQAVSYGTSGAYTTTIAAAVGSSVGLAGVGSVVVTIQNAAGLALSAAEVKAVTSVIASAVAVAEGKCTVSGITSGGLHYTASGDRFAITVVFAPYAIKVKSGKYNLKFKE